MPCLRRPRRPVAECRVGGIRTNLAFHERFFGHPSDAIAPLEWLRATETGRVIGWGEVRTRDDGQPLG